MKYTELHEYYINTDQKELAHAYGLVIDIEYENSLLDARVTELESENETQKNEIYELEHEISSLNSDLLSINNSNSELLSSVSDYKETILDLEIEIDKLRYNL